MKEDGKMVVKIRFERINDIMLCKSYIKNEHLPDNKEEIIYGFGHFKTDNVVKYIPVGCESHDLWENDKFFNLRSNKFINEEIEMRDFKITG